MKITPLLASTFRSDGGAMFGLVPKPIWSKLIPPNERNGIPQNANSLLLELDDGRRVIVDTGCGNPAWFTDKERDISGLDDAWPLMDSLTALDISPDDIDFVVLSHLHWDHCGGVGRMNEAGEVELTFPNAQHFVHTLEWQDATSGDPVLGNAYPPRAWEPLEAIRQDGLLLITDAAPDILPGVRMARSGGHTLGHCAVVITGDPLIIQHPDARSLPPLDTAVYAGDNCPTAAHLRLLFQTAYDMYPLETRSWKLDHLPEIASAPYLLFFDHDPEWAGAIIEPDEKREYRIQTGLAVVSRREEAG